MALNKLKFQHIKRFEITLVGAGNLGWHLGHAFKEKGIRIANVISRTLYSAQLLASEIDCEYSISVGDIDPRTDIILVAVDDSHLEEVLTGLKNVRSIILHTCGSIDIDIFNGICKQYGVFYPFQTFTKGVPVDFGEVPVLIEASDMNTLEVIRALAESISRNVKEVNSEQRQWIHLCGVLVNNFTNHLVARATDLMQKHRLDTKLLLPLAMETVAKLEKTTAFEAQTGPARRKNHAVIEKHLELLSDETELKKLYSLLTDSIIAYYSK
jgi:predicted short-subunit dehydrogenase-like oxidoreductase (DUF2520 family)